MRQKLSFVIVGAIGFLADALALYVLLAVTPASPLVARIGSIAFALCVTWACNRTFTFDPSGRSAASEAARYGAVGAATSLFNYLVFASVISAVPATPPIIALAVASLAAMVLSYLGYLKLVFDR